MAIQDDIQRRDQLQGELESLNNSIKTQRAREYRESNSTLTEAQKIGSVLNMLLARVRHAQGVAANANSRADDKAAEASVHQQHEGSEFEPWDSWNPSPLTQCEDAIRKYRAEAEGAKKEAEQWLEIRDWFATIARITITENTDGGWHWESIKTEPQVGSGTSDPRPWTVTMVLGDEHIPCEILDIGYADHVLLIDAPSGFAPKGPQS